MPLLDKITKGDMVICYRGFVGGLLLLDRPNGVLELTIIRVGLLGGGIRVSKARRGKRGSRLN